MQGLDCGMQGQIPAINPKMKIPRIEGSKVINKGHRKEPPETVIEYFENMVVNFW